MQMNVQQKGSSSLQSDRTPDHLRLLIVDDEQEICLLLKALFHRFGARTVMAHTLGQARELLNNGPFDGIFLDVNLPDGKGYELIPALRVNSPDARVIVISAMDQEREHALAAGADLFIPKPLDRTSVLNGMRKLELLDPEQEHN
jgi:DNA-binding response OmpR family regulator